MSRPAVGVFSCCGLDWYDIELMEEGSELPVERVVELLDMLLNREPRFPTREEITLFNVDADAGADDPEEAEASRVASADGFEARGRIWRAGYVPGFGVRSVSPGNRLARAVEAAERSTSSASGVFASPSHQL